MNYTEEKRDLFTVPDNYVLAHCISSDFAMGAGIAKRFTAIGVKERLVGTWPQKWDGKGYMIPVGLKDKIVLNLVTKERYWMKPTYQTIRESLEEVKSWLLSENKVPWMPELSLAMPKIGCGLDKLSWDKVSQIIKEVFRDTNINILICVL